MVKIYHFGIMKLLPSAPAYILIAKKGYIHPTMRKGRLPLLQMKRIRRGKDV